MKTNLAIETFVIADKNNGDLLLCGLDGIQHASIDLSSAYYYKHITDDNKVTNIFGYGPENIFFYKLSSYKDNVLVGYEKGLGYAYINDNKTYFKREIPILYGKNEDHAQIIQNNISKFYCQEGSINVITSEIPTNSSILFYDKNCIVVSKDRFIPTVLKIAQNSFLARIGENDLASVSFDSKDFSEATAKSVAQYSKQLSLKCSKLSTNKLSIKQLQLESSDGSGAKAGTLVYDSELDVIKFYNGTKWRILKWEDEEKME